jgi:hypothetical protein
MWCDWFKPKGTRVEWSASKPWERRKKISVPKNTDVDKECGSCGTNSAHLLGLFVKIELLKRRLRIGRIKIALRNCPDFRDRAGCGWVEIFFS